MSLLAGQQQHIHSACADGRELLARLVPPVQLWQLCCVVLPEGTQLLPALPSCSCTAAGPTLPLILRGPTPCSSCQLDGMRGPTKSVQAGSVSFCNQYVPEAGFQNWSKSLFHTGTYNYSTWFSFSDLSQNFRACDFCPIRSILALISVLYGFTMFYTISSYSPLN